MKNLLNNISQEEKNRILEMHSSKKNVIKEDNSLGSNKKVLTLSNAWDFYLDAHFQHVLDEVIGEPFDENHLHKYFKVMVGYMKDNIKDDMKNVYDNYKLGFDLKDINFSFKQFANAVQAWEYTKDDEEPSFEEEDDFLHSFGKEMGMFDDADDEDYNFHNRGFDEK